MKCDAETNPPDLRERARSSPRSAWRQLSPAEFIVVRIIHRAGRGAG